MRRIAVLALLIVLTGTWLGLAADPPPLSVAEGKIEKVEKEAIVFQPRGTGGRFGKSIVLKLTGTSNLSNVSFQERAGKHVLVQREIKLSDLKANHLIAVIYSSPPKGEPVLLSAVVQATGEK
jgi:hypothetical protein